MARVDARERNAGGNVSLRHANQRKPEASAGASRDEAASHQSHDRCRGAAVWTTQRIRFTSVSAVMYIVSGHDAALGVPDDAEPLQTGAGADSLSLSAIDAERSGSVGAECHSRLSRSS